MKLTNKIIEAISRSLKYSLFEQETINYNIKIYDHKNCNDYEYIKSIKNFLYNFLNQGYIYANLGNYCGCTSSTALLKNFSIIKIAYLDEEIIAVSVYTGYQDGKKCVGITATTNDEYREIGKKAVINIVQNDINLFSDFYWVECSGAVEHLYKKHGGIMIPNDYIELFIGNRFDKKLEDGYHFSVKYKATAEDSEDTKENKVIFGFNNKKTYDIVKEKLDASILKQIDFIMNSIEEEKSIIHRDKYQAAHDVIYVFYDEKCQGINEFSKELLDVLKNSANTLKEYIKSNPNDKRKEKFETALWNAQDILDTSTVLALNKL